MSDDNAWMTRQCSQVVDRSSDPVRDAWVRTLAPEVSGRDETVRDLVYQPGRRGDLRDQVIELLAGAEDVAVLSSFLIASPEVEAAITSAAARDVRVYLLTASEQRLNQEPKSWSETDHERAEEHRALLDRLAGKVLVRTAAGFHAKVVLVDPRTKPRGLILTANLVHVDLEANVEVGVRLDPTETQGIFGVLRWAFWEMAEHELSEPGRLHAIKPAGVVSWRVPSAPIAVKTADHDTIASSICEAVRSAERVVISNFGWAVDHPVVQALVEAVHNGTSVTVLARASSRAKRSIPALLVLARAGARVLGYRRLHAKVVRVEFGPALVHTANFIETRNSSLEVGVWLDGARADAVSAVVDGWVEDAPWELVTEAELRHVGDRVVEVADGQWHERVVVDEVEVSLPDVESASALDLVASPRLPNASAPDGVVPRTVRFSWTVKAPHLKSGSREVFVEDIDGGKGHTPFDPKVFDERGKRRVVAVTSQAELRKARSLLKKVNADAVVVRAPPPTPMTQRKRK